VLRLLRVAYGNAPHARRDLPEHRQPLAGEHDRDRAALPLQRGDDRGHMREDYIGLQGDQFVCKRLKLICPVSREATAMQTLRPSDHLRRSSPCRNAATRAFVSGSSSA